MQPSADVQQVMRELEKNEFHAFYVPDGAAAKETVLKLVPAGKSVGVGGSVTIRDLGLVEELRQRGHTVYDHWDKSLTPLQLKETLRGQRNCDVFLSSSNAIAKDGQLVNLDGSGNRVSCLTAGPEKVIVVASVNKITADVAAGIDRTKNLAAPENYRRKSMNTPCAKSGYCSNCRPPAKQCRALLILGARPRLIPDFNVILVGESLGI